MLRSDATEGPGGTTEHDALRVHVAALAAHACDELTVGHAGRDEDRVVALHEVVGLVDPVHVETGVDSALTLIIIARPQTALDVPAERLDGACRDDALGAATDADAHV